MVRPVRFGYNDQTASSNAFQQAPGAEAPETVQAQALREFDLFVKLLRDAGVQVTVFDDHPEPHTPDSIFPNNWISFHPEGTAVLYPMHAPNRRAERRSDVVDSLSRGVGGFRLLDLTAGEAGGHFLEGTGSLVLDRVHRIAYACRSPRTDPELLEAWGRELGYEPFVFDALDAAGGAIYHTNVMMAVGDTFAVVCLESVQPPEAREALARRLRDTGHEILEISLAQMEAFAGNMLQVHNADGERFTVLSARAHAALGEAQRALLARHSGLIVVPLDVIETYGGGSVRCMLAEVFPPFGQA